MSAAHPLAAALDRGLDAMGLPLDASARDLLLRYVDELTRWNGAYNLTAVRDPRDMLVRHLLDSLALLPLLRAPQRGASLRLLDVGSGAGLPGIVLAIAEPRLAVTVLDSNGKKARFLRHVQRRLGLANVEVAEARVEDHQATDGYAYIVSRAFAALADFLALTRHLLAPGGQWLAMKGKLDEAELAAVPPSVRIRETHRLQVPGLGGARHVVIAESTT
ncbi:16S rRNA (guanine(527)-N(7))-methyltransferase RsmG [Sinimarinibacterium thermocellulolyticum]|uniref:Ribosomal RNA small subunit methyltransferase G n=1 Tax=Sinimarinibacterium thermocellulolyticum TaxID=3170016 RepID=A0ABV2A8B6_9GAMM